MSKRRWPLRLWAAYWWQYGWFYVWKWTIGTRLHKRTIRPVNQARQDYLDQFRRVGPEGD